MIPADQMQNDQYAHLKKVIEEKKKIRNPLIEILRSAQEIFGYLPVEVQEFIAQELNIPVNQIYGVVTFYNFFTMTPRGKYNLNVCLGTACFVKGAPRLVQMLSEELGIQMGETTKDGIFTMSAVRCVGACSLAPVFVIGEETYGRIDSKDKIAEILKRYK
ncbi:MAG: NAD(P)H-dependent oxidoreductase subunit E [Candidatus Cloacimonadota bacterium]|jgi:NADH-quinone oxidoreductase subunit E/NADP-reducing hydrogenase subunit HndA|uniref:[Fe] hydrogenase (Fe-only hydrogenase) (Ferredoxin bidirectional hydrogenase), subunit gamma n=1 Tax=Cloacimonas acidaminovorans (strain Evry) TaxID=459349 RepID=B0VI72_CLOAI|nr:NAD(P)H-dependent oxidoreductase subunit E [Candidatus Cloacimonas acidaminovorans]MBP8704877.1 NAD(P)H-dependent oxidoreductase subunit E [Candidatus Cloacimonas sp.]MDI9571984.1 NAD(P)H-dependent oxidoreductase subunit E [Candidatus Cloacimonadota bacterium]MDY0239425.1 NAD(P)H-dependent oxidoreductase subunit E [Bacteroidales bacterium]OQC72451.1 MAG: NADP-reducing hydrogenase subunit HndA [Candidatus Cloacimonetes bacterium ADurb.Bin003]MCK9610522.1 NAD(P)H-dependent oxidoreductase subu